MHTFELTGVLTHRDGNKMVELSGYDEQPNPDDAEKKIQVPKFVDLSFGHMFQFIADQPTQGDFRALARIGDLIYEARRFDPVAPLVLNDAELEILKIQTEAVAKEKNWVPRLSVQLVDFLNAPIK